MYKNLILLSWFRILNLNILLKDDSINQSSSAHEKLDGNKILSKVELRQYEP